MPLLAGNAPVTGQNGLFASAVLDKKTNEIILKIVNTSDRAHAGDITLDGVNKLDKKGTLTVLKSGDLHMVNSLDDPAKIAPVEGVLAVKGKKVNVALAPYSLSVVKIKVL